MRFGLNPTAEFGGITKDQLGKVLLFGSMVVLALVCWRRWRGRENVAVTTFAAMWLWSTFIWPTRVHERYMLLTVPLIIVLATGLRRYWPAVAALLVLGVAELTVNLWITVGAGRFEWAADPRYQTLRQGELPWETLMTIVSLAGYAWAFGAAAFGPEKSEMPVAASSSRLAGVMTNPRRKDKRGRRGN
jgi:hypothetical protein